MDNTLPVWLLKRQDDHGNQYVVEKFASEEEAISKLQYYEAKGHKQNYWIERLQGD